MVRVFIASTILIVSLTFFNFLSISENFLPGSNIQYVVPIIGDVTLVPLISM